MAWIQQDSIFRKTTSTAITDTLPLGTYFIKKDDYGFYLEQVENFILPEKIYGEDKRIERWLHSYRNNPKNTGIILHGLKGSGKTLTSKQLALKSNLPVIILDTPYYGTDFYSFVTTPDFKEVCFFIDEFEKVYTKESESAFVTLLSLLDGASNSHNLFVFTCNSIPSNNFYNYLVNRPSRIKYIAEYLTLEEDVIQEVISDLLVNKEHSSNLISACEAIGQLSFDSLISIIKEMNLFQEDASTCISYMNIIREHFYVKVEELWNNTYYKIKSDMFFNPGMQGYIHRNFNAIPDPKYHDIDDNVTDIEKEGEGLFSYAEYEASDIKRISPKQWEIKNNEGTFRVTVAPRVNKYAI